MNPFYHYPIIDAPKIMESSQQSIKDSLLLLLFHYEDICLQVYILILLL
jgi:hypothetical protein